MSTGRFQGFNAMFWVLGIVLLAYIAIPILYLAFLFPSQEMAVFSRSEVIAAIEVSIVTASLTTLLAAIFGVPLAYQLSHKDFWGRNLSISLIHIPLVLPPMIVGILLLLVFGPRGPLAQAEISGTVFGVVAAQFFVATPFTVIAGLAAFEGVDPKLEQASRILGKSELETFFNINIPLAWRGIVIGLILTWLRAVGELGATMMMAYNPHTLSVQLWEDNATYGIKGVIGTSFLVIFAILVFLPLIRLIAGEERFNRFGV